MQNYMISLWFVALVVAPFNASRTPLERTAAIQLTYSVWQRLR